MMSNDIAADQKQEELIRAATTGDMTSRKILAVVILLNSSCNMNTRLAVSVDVGHVPKRFRLTHMHGAHHKRQLAAVFHIKVQVCCRSHLGR